MTIAEVEGVTSTEMFFMRRTLVVRFTSGEKGDTLSIEDEGLGIMLAVRFEEIEGIIKQERGKA